MILPLGNELISTSDQSGKLTSKDRRVARLWQWMPWLVLIGLSILPASALALAYLLSGGATAALAMGGIGTNEVILLSCVGIALLAMVLGAFFSRKARRKDGPNHAAIRQYREWEGRPEGENVLVAVARYLAAHCPTQRARLQTAEVALRLHRGESLFDGDEPPEDGRGQPG